MCTHVLWVFTEQGITLWLAFVCTHILWVFTEQGITFWLAFVCTHVLWVFTEQGITFWLAFVYSRSLGLYRTRDYILVSLCVYSRSLGLYRTRDYILVSLCVYSRSLGLCLGKARQTPWRPCCNCRWAVEGYFWGWGIARALDGGLNWVVLLSLTLSLWCPATRCQPKKQQHNNEGTNICSWKQRIGMPTQLAHISLFSKLRQLQGKNTSRARAKTQGWFRWHQ